MAGQKAALGLFLLLAIGSGLAGITDQDSEDSSFTDLNLSLEEVENATGANYTVVNGSVKASSLNFSSTLKEIGSLFERESNLSEAPETVQSMVVAINGSEEDPVSGLNSSEVKIGGFPAEKADRDNQTVLYGQEGNVSFIVRTEGRDGLYSSARDLYISIAEKAEELDW